MLRRILVSLLLALSALSFGQERIRDVIYAKSGGAAFTMDVFKPKTPNGAAVIFLVSGGWVSNHDQINPGFAEGLNNVGFTVFEVVHGSQPKYTISEIEKQVTRAVRFVHANAKTYGIDDKRIGITGASAGGHLSLLVAAKGDAGDPTPKDSVDQAPSTVATAAVFFPPTDFLNYGSEAGAVDLNSPVYAIFRPAFGVGPTTPAEQVQAVGKAVSPIQYVTAKMPPVLLIHGDSDSLVPLQQSERFRDAVVKAGGTAELMVVKGGKHDASVLIPGVPRLIAWFTEKLKA